MVAPNPKPHLFPHAAWETLVQSLHVQVRTFGHAVNGPRSLAVKNGTDIFHHLHFAEAGEMVWHFSAGSHRVRAGEAALAPCTTPIQMEIPTGYRHWYVSFSARFERRDPEGNVLRVSEALHHLKRGMNVGRFEADRLSQLYRRGPRDPQAYLELTNLVAGLIAPHCRIPDDLVHVERDLSRDFGPIGTALRAGLRVDHTVSHFAALMGLERATLSQRFRRAHGKPLKPYLAARLNERACALVLTGGMGMREIAGLLGFSDEMAFNRFFKTHNGAPPLRWRKQFR